MKTRFLKIAGIAVATLLGFASCQDFLEDKKTFDAVTEDAYDNWAGALARLSDCHTLIVPRGTNDGLNWQFPSTGRKNEITALCTEEYAGLSWKNDYGTYYSFSDPTIVYDVNNYTPDWFQGSKTNVREGVWGHIRNVNDVIRGVSASKLSEDQKNQLLGQLYFLRAWRYFMVWKWYGGVPIITEPQPTTPESVVPRSSTKETLDFILEDLNNAADLLEPFTGSRQWLDGENYGRITTGTALAVKARVLAWWCSPLFNRAQDPKRYEDAMKEIAGDLDRINACGYGFSYNDADQWADMFNIIGGNTDAVYFSRHNSYVPGKTPDYQRNNTWESQIRPANAKGTGDDSGGIQPAKTIIDLFPMADGKLPAGKGSSLLPHSSETYNEEYPFLNRDPRFYRTFAFPGMQWKFDGDPTGENNRNPFKGSEYELWNYVWYEKAANITRESSDYYGADNLLGSRNGVYITKRSAADPDKGAYEWGIPQGVNAFQLCYASFLELRYAEVLLNIAEIACGAGDTGTAYEYLREIRRHAGYSGDCGIVEGDQAACFAAILYERQIELAFEGKRFDDVRRWMLFDGGSEVMSVAGAPDSWKLTGWSGNTCTYLGMEPLNGKRRETFVYRVSSDINGGLGSTTWDSFEVIPDPIANYVIETEFPDIEKGKEWETYKKWRSEFSVDLSKKEDLQANLENLVEKFYKPYLTYQEKRGDGTDGTGSTELAPHFPAQCYFLGFTSGVQTNNPTLPNNIGWGNGTFDPLAE